MQATRWRSHRGPSQQGQAHPLTPSPAFDPPGGTDLSPQVASVLSKVIKAGQVAPFRKCSTSAVARQTEASTVQHSLLKMRLSLRDLTLFHFASGLILCHLKVSLETC